MARMPKLWFRESMSAWYVYLDGRQVRLDADETQARLKYHRLMLERGLSKPGESMTLQTLWAHYLDHCARRHTSNTLRTVKLLLGSFVEKYGHLDVGALQPGHVEAWEAGRRWGPTTLAVAKTKLQTLMRYGVKFWKLPDPLGRLEKPAPRSRGAETLITREQFELMLANSRRAFRNVLLALWHTGARPGEVTSVTAKEFDAERGLWVLRSHKTAHKGFARIVHLPQVVVELCRELAERHPEGPLFRNGAGKPYGWCGLSRRMNDLCKRLGLPAFSPYSVRHSFATDALSRGVPDAIVAELLGHRGTAMLHKHYAHLVGRHDVLKEALAKVRA